MKTAGLMLMMVGGASAVGHQGCQDNAWWKDRDGDGCRVYRSHSWGPKWACSQPGYEDALRECPQTCGTCPPSPRPSTCERYNNDCFGCTSNGCYYEQSSGRCGESSRCDFFKAEDPKLQAHAVVQLARKAPTVCVQTPDQCNTGFGTCEVANNAWDCNKNTWGLDCEWTRWGCRARLEHKPTSGAGNAECLTYTAVRGYNLHQLKGRSQEECIRACIDYFGCTSVEHHPQTNQCVLSDATRVTPTIRSRGGWSLCYL